MLTLEEFYQEFIQAILAETDSRGLMKSEIFLDKTIEKLVEDGELGPNCEIAEYKKRGIDVSGYDYDEERKILTIVSSEFYQEEKIETLTKSIIDSKFKNAENFLKKNEEEPTMVTKSQGRGPEEELSFSPSTSQGCVLR